MFNEWKVLHLDEVEAESILFCRALGQNHFNGHCESVRSVDEAKTYLETGLYAPQVLSRPDIIVINLHPDCDAHILEFVRWIRIQPQLHGTPIILFIKAQLPLTVQERAQEDGVTELIVRSDSFEDLVPKVRGLLERCVNRWQSTPTKSAEPAESTTEPVVEPAPESEPAAEPAVPAASA